MPKKSTPSIETQHPNEQKRKEKKVSISVNRDAPPSEARKNNSIIIINNWCNIKKTINNKQKATWPTDPEGFEDLGPPHSISCVCDSIA